MLIFNVTFINLAIHTTSTYDIFIVNAVGKDARDEGTWQYTLFKWLYGFYGLYTSVLWLSPSIIEVAVGNLLHSELTLFRLALADKIKQGR